MSKGKRALAAAGDPGKVRELRQAASQSPAVRGVLERFAAATTRAEQRALLDELLVAWADTSGMAGTLEERAKGKFRIEYAGFGRERRERNIADTAAFVEAASGSGGGAAHYGGLCCGNL